MSIDGDKQNEQRFKSGYTKISAKMVQNDVGLTLPVFDTTQVYVMRIFQTFDTGRVWVLRRYLCF